jgi:chromosome segregation ATPase
VRAPGPAATTSDSQTKSGAIPKRSDESVADVQSQLQTLLRDKNILQEQIERVNLERDLLEQNLTLSKHEVESFSNSIVSLNKELDDARRERKNLEKERGDLTLQIEELERNSTVELLSVKEELKEAYEEIGQLEEDIRSVAGGSIQRLRQHSFLWRLIAPIIGFVRMGGGAARSRINRDTECLESEIKDASFDEDEAGGSAFLSGSRDKHSRSLRGRKFANAVTRRRNTNYAATDADADAHADRFQIERIDAMNRTISRLRENLTAMSNALESKEDLICELSDQIVETEEEAEKRRKKDRIIFALEIATSITMK